MKMENKTTVQFSIFRRIISKPSAYNCFNLPAVCCALIVFSLTTPLNIVGRTMVSIFTERTVRIY